MSRTSAVFFDVDFTLIHPGPRFQASGYLETCARHGVVVDPTRFDAAVAGAIVVLDEAAQEFDPQVFIDYTARIIELELADQQAPMKGQEGPVTLSGLVERYLASHFATFPDGLPPAGLHDRVLEEVERPLIALTLAGTRGNQVRAAEILGLNRNTLRKKIQDLGVEMSRGRR